MSDVAAKVKEIIVDQNVGSGAVEAGSAVATGLVILGSIYGEGGSVLTVLIYFAIGQLILVLTSFVYNWITPYDIHEHIERDNIAVGIGFAGALVAIGNLVRNALVHTFVDWETNILWLVLEVLLGLMLLPLARWMADKILLPGQNLNDEIVNQEKPNVGAGLIEAFAYVGGSMLICWAL
ncbi:MAG: DUF350 domain-containing protein [Cytophagales bacterium]|nr:DUF350 domain-containing protein [Cytophagales bacterium]